MMRDSFVFYRSFYNAIKKLSPEDFKDCFVAIADYALDGKEVETDGIERTVFELIKPQIDANNKRYENGSKGGRPKTENKPNANQEKPNNNQNKPNDNQTITNHEPNVNENVNVNDIKKKDTNVSKEKAPRFIPPTRQEVTAYCEEKGYNIDVERFIDYYTANGWMVGRNKMKDWKAAVRNWKRGQRQGMTTEPKVTKFQNFEQREYDMDNLTRELLNN